ncbi:glycoside hydrolase family 16 protein, partial [Aquimarina sp. M1]
MDTIKIILFLTFFIIVNKVANSQSWDIVWQDEFDNGISSDWVFETGNGSSGWGNNELQYYRRENATVENGKLVITAKRESVGGYNYTSSRMKTQGRKSFKYGKIEARIALPSGQGLWPAFWMLGDNISSVGWPACGEIDIMEHVNTSPDVHGTIHWQDNNGNYASYGGYTQANITEYHVYSVEWDENSIKWFVDGNQYHIVDISNGINGTSEFHNEYFLLLNLAVGGNWPGFSIDDSKLPARMYVDYVRVYRAGSGNPNPTTGNVTLYRDCSFNGFSVGLSEGSYTMTQLAALGIPNDNVSS